MVAHRAKSKRTAEMMAANYRKKGFNCSVFKKKKGYGVSVKRK
jgi:hypothetical protein